MRSSERQAEDFPEEIVQQVLEPPFHRLLSHDEMMRHCILPGSPPPDNDQMNIGEEWNLAAFRLALKDAKGIAWGWVKGPFAVHSQFFENVEVGTITHLPTGLKIASIVGVEAAAAFGDLISPIGDWHILPTNQAAMRDLGARMHATVALAGYTKADGYPFYVRLTQ